MKKRPVISLTISLLLMAVILSFINLITGPDLPREVVVDVRLPRLVTAILAGAALSLSGAQMQSVLRNPLADPYIMGVSSGACLGAAVATLMPWSNALTIGSAAFLGSLISAAAVLFVSAKYDDSRTLLVFGVMLGFILSAFVTVIQSYAGVETLKSFHGWLAGSFSTTTWSDIILLALSVLVGFVLSYISRNGLDALLFGDEYATMCGYLPSRVRLTSILSCCILTSSVTALCGPIGFVGIVSPHIVRTLSATSSHKVVLPLSLLCGAVVTLFADFLSRLSSFPIPVSATMAVVGVPIIIYILLKKS